MFSASPYDGLAIAARDYSDLDLSDFERRGLVERDVPADAALVAGATTGAAVGAVTYGAARLGEGVVHVAEKAAQKVGHFLSSRQLEERDAIGNTALIAGATAGAAVGAVTYGVGEAIKGGIHLAKDAGRDIKNAFD